MQKLEGATQKSLDEEVRSADNVPTESTASQKPKTADEDSAQTKPADVQPTSSSSALMLKRDGKSLHVAEEAKEKSSHATGTNASAHQNEQGANAQEKDTVDSAETTAVVTPQSKESENVTPNDKTDGT